MLATTYGNNFQLILLMSGANADSSKRTNIRIFIRLEKCSFVTFRIFVSALHFSTGNPRRLQGFRS